MLKHLRNGRNTGQAKFSRYASQRINTPTRPFTADMTYLIMFSNYLLTVMFCFVKPYQQMHFLFIISLPGLVPGGVDTKPTLECSGAHIFQTCT